MSPARLRKIALYLEYIAFVLREEAKAEEKENPPKVRKAKAKPAKKGS